ncbi:hypothetical protein FKM82_024484 [Ascaphus truei]
MPAPEIDPTPRRWKRRESPWYKTRWDIPISQSVEASSGYRRRRLRSLLTQRWRLTTLRSSGFLRGP